MLAIDNTQIVIYKALIWYSVH